VVAWGEPYFAVHWDVTSSGDRGRVNALSRRSRAIRGTMNAHRWILRSQLPDGRIVVELVALAGDVFVAVGALELFLSCCACAPSYGLIALGADRTVVG
jgi:hypothetical protein